MGFFGEASGAARVGTVVAKVADEIPVCGCCKEAIHPKVSICLPKDATLRSDALAAVPGGRHGRVHSECAWPQVLLRELEDNGSGLRDQTRRRLLHAIAAAPRATSPGLDN